MRSIDMLCPTTDEDITASTEIEENTSAINKLIETLENKIVINELDETENDNEESEEEAENE